MENNEIAKWLDNEIAEATKFRKNEAKEAEFNYWLGATDALECVKRKFFESISSSPPSPAIEGKGEIECECGMKGVQNFRECPFYVRHPIDGKTYCSRVKVQPTPPAGATEDHIHRVLPSGAVARVPQDASPELLSALDRMCEIAKNTVDAPAGAEGEGEPTVTVRNRTETEKFLESELSAVQTERDNLIGLIEKQNVSILGHIARRQELEAELAGAIQSGRNIVDQNCALLKKRDGFIVSWDTREKMLDEVVRQRDALQAEVNSLKEWIDSHH